MDEMENLVFPLTMQKYTSKGPSKAKGSVKIVNNKEEYKLLKNTKEDWRIKK